MEGQNVQERRPARGGEPQRKRKKAGKTKATGAVDEVEHLDVRSLLKKAQSSGGKQGDGQGEEATPTVVYHPSMELEFPEIEVTISELSSTGDGLALSPAGDHVYVVPFTLPGDRARIRVHRTHTEHSFSASDLIEVLTPSSQRDDSLINCKYFGQCGGCQLQMLPYDDQLKHKKRIIEKAYVNFSGLLPELVPAIQDTMPSPMQYGYRTKLTPHFTRPRAQKGTAEEESSRSVVPPIGFGMKGRRKVMDIEDCPLGTDIVRYGLKQERVRVAENIHKYKNGATLLIRETTARKEKTDHNDGKNSPKEGKQAEQRHVIRKEFPGYIEEKDYITDSNAISVEYVEDYQFRNVAGTFFQNNNSILPTFTDYIRTHSNPPQTPCSTNNNNTDSKAKLKYLLDAYCGSGLFTITLSGTFKSSLGVDVAPGGIKCARENARLNKLSNTGFTTADAAHLFRDVPYPANQTLIVIDPPRKGCDDEFLNQMLAYGPTRVLYVSCNVHTQARDVGKLVQGKGGVRYEIENIRGFDFFPQTNHVESVAVLNKVVES